MSTQSYRQESASAFFEELERAAAEKGKPRKAYARLQAVMTRFLSERTSATGLVFAGPFARMDYLLKGSHAPWRLVNASNAARNNIRKFRTIPEKSLREAFPSDLKALCRFIAFIDKADIPEELSALFPPDVKEEVERHVLADEMRMIVDSWDDRYVYGKIENYPEEGDSKVDYAGGNKYFPFDWSYLKTMFHDGAQLNLVRPHAGKDGTILPELIIYEPDYLVNVTAVARCFTEYAESPFVSLISKVAPMADSQPILLGNLAGQLLDEELNGDPWPDDEDKLNERYRASIMRFFRDYALGMLTTDIDSKQFHNDARQQARNIHHAIAGILSAEHGYNAREGIVEPSFFSEMLGLQGRMDYLQMDFRFLIEQKAGKGGFPYEDFVEPKWKLDHLVQLQLYMLLFRYNFRKAMEAVGNDFQPFLLYSKYVKSLLRVNSMPEIIFKAIRVRNGIAWLEMQLTQPGRYRIYETLTADKLNMKHVAGRLWTEYQKPQIEQVLGVFHRPDVSELEKSYFFRFMTFISNEHVLSKFGNNTKECSGFASTWHASLLEKRLAGNIFDDLVLVSPDGNDDGEKITTVDLKYSGDVDNDMANFRIGDIVILYAYRHGEEPDARKAIILRCTIREITNDGHLILTLRHPQSDARLFRHEKGKVWAIEHDFMEASYSGLYRGMFSFLVAPKSRRDLLMLQRKPEVDEKRQIKGDYGYFNDLALRVKQAKDFFLVIGPPGTGKTSFGLLNTLKEELLEPGSSVMLMAYTNRAVDEICTKMTEAGIDYIRIGGSDSCTAKAREHLIANRIATAASLSDVRRMLTETRVYVGTTTAISSHLNIFDLKAFDLAIIDEASQILEPHLMGILSARHGEEAAIRKFVMIGDHKQLPAVVQQTEEVSHVDDPQLNAIGLYDCRYSLFERLLRRYARDKHVVYMLTRQGRMHPDIADFPNQAFYNGHLMVVPRPHQEAVLPQKGRGENGIDDMLLTRRIAFLNSEKPVETPSDKVNAVEAEMIAATVERIYRLERTSFDAQETVGVIVPYRNQIAAVRKLLDKYNISALHDIAIDTVERFQGSQRRYIVYGFTVQKYYQLNFLTDSVFEDTDHTIVDRKLNVAMTRAEEHLIMIGNAALLENVPTFERLIEFIKGKESYLDIDKERYVRGEFSLDEFY